MLKITMHEEQRDIQQLKDTYAKFIEPNTGDSNGEYVHSDERVWDGAKDIPIKTTKKSMDECIGFMSVLLEKYLELGKKISVLGRLAGELQNMQLGMCNCFPTEYDEEMLLWAHAFVPVFVKKSEHWSYRHINRNEREKYKNAFIYAYELWRRIIGNIEAHNFKIGKMTDDSEVYFSFTIANIPGKFVIRFPIGKKYGARQMNQLPCGSLMQMHISYAMATMEHAYNTIGSAYRINELSGILKEFVELNKYKEYLPKDTIEHKCLVDGEEYIIVEDDEIPQSTWDAIKRSQEDASVEQEAKDCHCEQCGKPITATEYQCGGCVCYDCATELGEDY